MKKNNLFLLFAVFTGLNASLVSANSIISNAPTPQQMYQSIVRTNNPTQSVIAANTMIPSHAEQTKEQLDALNKEVVNYQQQSEQQLAALSDRNRSLSDQLQGLNQMILLLSQQMTQLRVTQERLMTSINLKSVSNTATETLWKQWLFWLRDWGFIAYINFGAAMILLISVGFFVGRLTRKTIPLQVHANTVSDGIEDEYDFMETNEAVPALLDLARSYLAMNDVNQAKTALQKVMQRGNVTECKEAQNMLNKINEKTKC